LQKRGSVFPLLCGSASRAVVYTIGINMGAASLVSAKKHSHVAFPLAAALALSTAATYPVHAAVDFAIQVHPILEARCQPCHSGDKPPAGLRLTDQASVLKGGVSGPALVPGDAKNSLLILRVTHQRGALMPPLGSPLTDEQVAVLRAWIDEGAAWPEMKRTDAKAPTASAAWVAPIAPRTVPVPPGSEANPIDRFVTEYLTKHGQTLPPPVSDAVFARRAYFDLWGLPPTVEQLSAFMADPDLEKRGKLVDHLLADGEMYSGHWMSWWNDLLRNDTGVNYQGDRKSITPWLIQALKKNEHYDQMIRDLVNPVRPGDPDGFLTGVNWRGTVNASQTPYMQAAQNTAQVFLGVNLKCASCHDSFINRYKLRESYGMAALFSETPQLELVRCDVKQGKFVAPALLYPELGSVPPNATLAQRHRIAAQFFTDPRNGRVPRTIVNRFWQKLFGRGLIQPVDEMDAEPWNADLLDWLAVDFTAHNWDLKYLLRAIMTSTTYQMPARVSEEQPDKVYTFLGPNVRRLTAEQFLDSVSAATGEWRIRTEGNDAIRVRDWELKNSQLSAALGRPIRDQVFTTREGRATTFQALELVNGDLLETLLRQGSLRLLNELPPAPDNLFDSGKIRKGGIRFKIDISQAQELWLLTEDAGSYDPARTVAGWVNVKFKGSKQKGTPHKIELITLAAISKFRREQLHAGDKKMGEGVVVPLGTTLSLPIASQGYTRMTGTVVVDDRSRPSDIGGSVRFFVFGAKPDPAHLSKIVGSPPVPEPTAVASVDDAVERFYLELLGRRPQPQEVAVAREYFRSGTTTTAKLQPAALEDFLWSLFMHPDFQYIY